MDSLWPQMRVESGSAINLHPTFPVKILPPGLLRNYVIFRIDSMVLEGQIETFLAKSAEEEAP